MMIKSSNQATQPTWAAQVIDIHSLIPGGSFLQGEDFSFNVVSSHNIVTNGDANIAATTIYVEPLGIYLPKGTILKFSEGRFVCLTEKAAVGATILTIEPLGNSILSGAIAIYQVLSSQKTVPSGTLVYRTYSDRALGRGFRPVLESDLGNLFNQNYGTVSFEAEIYLTANPVSDILTDSGCDLYKPGSLVRERFLPNWNQLSEGYKRLIRSLYVVV